MYKMPASGLLKKIEFQTALAPQNFFRLVNSGEKIEAIELNEKILEIRDFTIGLFIRE